MGDVLRKVTIPVPLVVPRERGIYSTGLYGASVRTRMTNKDRKMIQEASASLGVTMSHFMRWCSTYAAAKIKEEDDERRRAKDN